jgi:uncharacterized membrane-anchored protein
MPTPQRALPADDNLRHVLHNEVHARPSAAIQLPALVVFMAVYNDGIQREAELAHLRQLPGQGGLLAEALANQFLRIPLEGCVVTWERHTEFTRYSVVLDGLPAGLTLDHSDEALLAALPLPADWLPQVPGRTFCAILLSMVHGAVTQPMDAVNQARGWFGDLPVVASLMGNLGHSVVVTDFALRPSGFERMAVVAPPSTSRSRAGRISQRLLELETYRLMALRGLPVAKGLSFELSQAEQALSSITADLERKSSSDEVMLDTLVGLAAGVEKAMAQHVYRFSATRAYHTLVTQRITELREKPIPGIQAVGEFMQRRLSPAMATVASTERRLSSLSERVARTSDLLRTRVDIATEEQNRQLLEKLTKGQELQLRLQSTVEGLSIAAISYYVISLLLYGAKALKSAGLPVHPEMAAGALVPVVLWSVWRTTKRIHDKLHADH